MTPAYGYTPENTTYTKQLDQTAQQLRLASEGKFIKAYNEVTHSGSFWNAPSTVGGANLRAAYWLAIAARLGYTQVLGDANQFYKAAQRNSSATGQSERVAVLKAAVGALDRVGANKDKRVAPLYSLLGSAQDASRLALSTQLQYEQSTGGQLWEATKQTAKDVSNPLQTAAALWSGKKPPGESDMGWMLKKALFWTAIIGGVGLVGYFYVRPLLAPLTRVRDAAARAGHRAAAKAEEKLDRLASNPRRRSRR